MIKRVNDTLNQHDKSSLSAQMNRSPYVRTKIIGGYDAYTDKNGVTQFGEVVFETHNRIVLGGSLFTLEKVFGINAPHVYANRAEYLGDEYDINKGQSSDDYMSNTYVCLFGVGIGGSGNGLTDVEPVNYTDDEITKMIPLRLTANEITGTEAENYWFRTNEDINGEVEFDDKVGYYLKTIKSSVIRVLERNAEGKDDGKDASNVIANPTDVQDPDINPFETFVELTLNISRDDVREYFEATGHIEQARINSIGLFTGYKGTGDEDYKNVKLFSKLNINNEALNNNKDLTIVYRIYTS